jgi:hypothetical protein
VGASGSTWSVGLSEYQSMNASEEQSPADDTHLAAALGYLKRGWAVVPAGQRSRQPIIRWQRFQHEMPTEEQLTRWYERWPAANLAVITGAISGVVVIDIDPRHGGTESLASMETEHDVLPETVEAITGGGGRHLYFAHPGHEVQSRAGLAPGIDIRGDGGCVIVPPSVHPSGERYRWRAGHAPDDIELALLPVWLEQRRFREGSPSGHPLAYWRTLVHEGVKEGQRNTTIASFTGHLLWHGVDPDVVMEVMLAWNRVRCSPPLDEEEVIRTVRSIERTHRLHQQESAEVWRGL